MNIQNKLFKVPPSWNFKWKKTRFNNKIKKNTIMKKLSIEISLRILYGFCWKNSIKVLWNYKMLKYKAKKKFLINYLTTLCITNRDWKMKQIEMKIQISFLLTLLFNQVRMKYQKIHWLKILIQENYHM